VAKTQVFLDKGVPASVKFSPKT